MILFITIEIVCFLLLMYPVVGERNNDKRRDLDKKYDLLPRAAFMFGASLINYLLRDLQILHLTSFKQFALGMTKPLLMSLAIFFLCFDYIVHWRLGHRGWAAFTYLGTSDEHTFDKIKLWVRIGPWGRFAVRMVIFILALIYYFN